MLTASPTPNAHIGAHSAEASNVLRDLQYAIAQCRDAVFITDAAGIIARVNPAFEKLTGYSSHEAVGKDLSAITAEGPHSASYQLIWERTLEQRPFSGPLKLRRRSEECIAVEITITPVPDSEGQVTSLVCSCHRVEEASPSSAVAEAPYANTEQVSEVAHALNNLLMVAMSHAELAFDVLPVENPVRVQMQSIKQSCRRAPLMSSGCFTNWKGSRRKARSLRRCTISLLLSIPSPSHRCRPPKRLGPKPRVSYGAPV